MSNVFKHSQPVKFVSLPSAPTGEDGLIYYDETDGRFVVYQNGAWDGNVTLDDLTNYYTKSQTDGFLALKADQTSLDQEIADRIAADALLIPLTQKGANNGVATLDGSGKVPMSQLPNSVMTYEGTWNASTNTPTLTDGTGNAGMVYMTTVAGTTDFGNGNITFAVGDWAVYSGSTNKWEKVLNSNAVVSVNGQTGIVSLTTDHVPQGTTNKYYSSSLFNADFATKTTDNLTEGSTNLYFTNLRARTAAVANSTAGNQTDQAPSVDSIKTYVQSQGFLRNVIEDTTPELGGDLDVNTRKIYTAQNSLTVQSAQNTFVRSDGTYFIQDRYLPPITLSSSQTNTVIPAFTVAYSTINGLSITYRIVDTSNEVRIGTMQLVTNGTNITLIDNFTDTANTGIKFSAALNGSNINIRYTSGAKGGILSADVKQFRT